MILINPLLCNLVKNTTILRMMELLCLISILITEYKLYRMKCLKQFHSYESFLYGALGIISVGIIIRGNWPNTPNNFALHVLTTPVYLLPFIIVPLPNKKYFAELIQLFYKLSLWVIPLWLINISDLVQDSFHGESIGSYLPFISAFLLGLGAFFNRRQRTLNVILWLIFLLLMILNARRNVSFSLLVYAAIAYIFSMLTYIKKNKAKFILNMFGTVFIMLVLLLLVDSFTSGIFKRLANRANEDTRSGVEELFFADFASSPVSDWIFGRGMDGGYYQIVKNEETGETTDNRTVIETGYLHMVLKGGVAYDIIIVLIMLLSIKRGYEQNNRTCSFIATILCTYFIDLYTTNPIGLFYVRSILFWFCISITSEKVLVRQK